MQYNQGLRKLKTISQPITIERWRNVISARLVDANRREGIEITESRSPDFKGTRTFNDASWQPGAHADA